MAVYLVQMPELPQAGGPDGAGAAALERARFVRDGFSWPAALLAQLWLLYHQLWLTLAIWIVIEAAFFVVAYPHLPIYVAVAVDLVARVWLGFEAPRLRFARGARRAAATDVVAAGDRHAAEAVFFDRHAAALANHDVATDDAATDEVAA